MTNSLLIVDDEILSIEILKSQLDWKSMGIGSVFQAYSIKQALRVFEENEVDLLLCDVEMGNQNGLNLLKWVKENRPQTVSMILSGYAQFEYCQRAIELGSISYMLKPVEYEQLCKNIQNALTVFKQRNDNLHRIEQSENIRKSNQKLLKQFWSDVISGTIPAHNNAINEEARKMGIVFTPEGKYILVFLRWQIQEQKNAQERSEIRHILDRQVEQSLPGFVTAVPAFVNNDNYYILRQIGEDEEQIRKHLAKHCKAIQSNAKRALGIELKFCIGFLAEPEQLHMQFEQIYKQFMRMDGKQVHLFKEADSSINASNASYTCPDMQTWIALLEAGKSNNVCQMVYSYLRDGMRTGMLSGSNIFSFQLDFYHMLQKLAEKKHLKIAFSEEQRWMYLDQTEVENDIEHKLMWFSQQTNGATEASLHDKAKAFISEHLMDSDLSRQSIADHLNVNPEYLSRIFKKRENIPLVEFIQTKKVDVACKMLQQTELRISEIAAQLGYSNFAYFTHVFKRETGETPAAFRRKWKWNENPDTESITANAEQ